MWHTINEYEWEGFYRVNLPREELGEIHTHLQFNLYRTCLVYIYGVLRFLGESKRGDSTIMWFMKVFKPWLLGLGMGVVLMVQWYYWRLVIVWMRSLLGIIFQEIMDCLRYPVWLWTKFLHGLCDIYQGNKVIGSKYLQDAGKFFSVYYYYQTWYPPPRPPNEYITVYQVLPRIVGVA